MPLPKANRLIWISFAILAIEAAVAILSPRGHSLSLVGELFPIIFIAFALIGFRRNWLHSTGLLRSFWLLNGIGFGIMVLSQFYWTYYEVAYRHEPDNSIPGDALFFLSLIPVLAAIALRPHSPSTSQRLRFRRLDFILLMSWWFCLYIYFSIPWQYVVRDMLKYNHVVYLLFFVEHSAVVVACALWVRGSAGEWRKFYFQYFVAFLLFAIGNLVTSIALERQVYYSGSLYDLPWNLSLVWILIAIHAGRNLASSPQPPEIDEGIPGRWTARLAMLALLSLPALAIWSYLYSPAPSAIINFRLRLALGAMLPLGALVFLKIRLLDRELVRLVQLTASAVQNVKSVQSKLSQSQKMTALGRLASGAAHEISNPLTAILGYSELLADNPSLSFEERQCAAEIQQQVHRAQAAVNSMRNLERNPDAVPASLQEKRPSS